MGPHRDASASVRRQREWEEYKKSLYVVSMVGMGGKSPGLGLASLSNFREL